jgi:hypothetical protein
MRVIVLVKRSEWVSDCCLTKFRLPQKNVDAMYIGKSCGNVPCIMDLLVEETGVPGENHRPAASH